MTRHDTTVYFERKKAKTTAELQAHFADRQEADFKAGQWYENGFGDFVRLDDVTWMSLWGTLWKRYASGRWVCYGTRSWCRDGRYYHRCGSSLEDLIRPIPKPEWAEEMEAAQ